MIFKTPSIDGQEQEAIALIDEIRTRLQYLLQSPVQWTGLLRRNSIARAIQGSNTIEGYNATFEQAVAVVEGEEIDVSTETGMALRGYQTALTYVLRLANDRHHSINEEFIRSLHYMMMSYDQSKHPGQWRPGPIYVRREPSGERVYEGPDASEVPSLMRELVQAMQDADESVPAMVRAAMAHLNLVMIHPFSDGNGRMGRAIQTVVLTKDGVLDPIFTSIEEYLGSRGNTEAYYSVLADVGAGSWHPERDARLWMRFCLQAHLHQATTLERRVKEIARLWSDLEAEIERRKLMPRVIYALYDAAIGFRIRSERYRKAADVSAQLAARDLHALVAENLLAPKGEKRGRSYVASSLLLSMREKAREPRKPMPADLFKDQLNLL